MPAAPSNRPPENQSIQLCTRTESPTDIPIQTDWNARTPWWRPGLIETIRLIGWWWLLVIPVSGILLLLALAPADSAMWTLMWIGWIKLIVALLALPFLLAGYVFGKAAKARTEPFCIHCGHTLQGLPDNHRCPECGRRYSFAIIDEYRRDPQCFIYQWKQRQRPPKPARPAVTDRSKR